MLQSLFVRAAWVRKARIYIGRGVDSPRGEIIITVGVKPYRRWRDHANVDD